MASMASSTVRPMVGWGACALRWDQRASRGTQKMLAALYSSGSSGSAPSPAAAAAASSACLASNASLMYLRKMSPSTMCLYSAASMLLRSMSAEAQSLGSRPVVALAAGSVAAPRAAVRPPEARLVRAPRGLKSHPQLRRPLWRATRTDPGAPVPLSLPLADRSVVADLYAINLFRAGLTPTYQAAKTADDARPIETQAQQTRASDIPASAILPDRLEPTSPRHFLSH